MKNARLHSMIGFVVAMIFPSITISCKSSGGNTDTHSLVAPIRGPGLSPAELEGKIPVFIYYANNTTYTTQDGKDYFERFLAMLEEGQSAKDLAEDEKNYLSEVAERTRSDLKRFSAATETDLRELSNIFCSGPLVGKARLAVFNNDMATKPGGATWWSCSDEPLALSVPAKYASNAVAVQNPLAYAATLEQAFAAVRTKYGPENHYYILVTKSHGNLNNALSSWIKVDVRTLAAKAVRQAFVDYYHQQKAVSSAASAERPLDEPSKPLDDPNKAMEDPNKAMEDPNKAMEDPNKTRGVYAEFDGAFEGLVEFESGDLPGISKADYLAGLKNAGDKLGMNFPVVFMFSCKSALGIGTAGPDGTVSHQLANVVKLYGSNDSGIEYDEFDFGKLAAAGTGEASLISVFEAELNRLASAHTAP